MSKLDLQYDLQNLTPASASPPQANFTRIEQHVNQELVERDGTVAMRAQLKLVGDPVAELDAAPKQYVDAVLPVGIIMMYGGAAAPPGGRWALCNGAELQTTEYPELFAVLGVAYGGTSGRFNLPNLVDRFPRGATPGAVGGSADAVTVAHTHPIDHDHGAHAHAGVDHLHGDDHFHTGATAGASARHTHGSQSDQGFVAKASPGSGAVIGYPIGGYETVVYPGATADDSPDHAHAFNTNYKSQQGFTASTGAADRSLTTGSTGVSLSGTSGAANGAVSATNANLPPYVGVSYIVRVR